MKSIRDVFQALKNAPLLFVVSLIYGGIYVAITTAYAFVSALVFAAVGMSFGEGMLSFDEFYDEIGMTVQIVLMLFFVVIITVLGAFFSGGLVTVSKHALEDGTIKISQLFSGGKRYFWRMAVLEGFQSLVLVLLYTASIYIEMDLGVQYESQILLSINSIFLIVSFIVGMCKLGMVLQQLTMIDSIKSAFRLRPLGYVHILLVITVNILVLIALITLMSPASFLLNLLVFLVLLAYLYFVSTTAVVWIVAVYRNYSK
ncbi:hypothetical protein A374_18791 [Fictibacillus macauensis ZFHKF-1]|uniref:Uncharacterized protein n=1 Tax=Fictibacillus macauensis ZFHKF-1 TaxID=1196324 RepID=I8IWA0_9BACL|nr:hypothetical protein [Fictibacillus macauensis]EIT83766.1 hypothetical protein A374_18791 [Fictibacillus macauensis ZFHKF-1]